MTDNSGTGRANLDIKYEYLQGYAKRLNIKHELPWIGLSSCCMLLTLLVNSKQKLSFPDHFCLKRKLFQHSSSEQLLMSNFHSCSWGKKNFSFYLDWLGAAILLRQ